MPTFPDDPDEKPPYAVPFKNAAPGADVTSRNLRWTNVRPIRRYEKVGIREMMAMTFQIDQSRIMTDKDDHEHKKLALIRHGMTNATTKHNIGGVEKRQIRAGPKPVTLPTVKLRDFDAEEAEPKDDEQ